MDWQKGLAWSFALLGGLGTCLVSGDALAQGYGQDEEDVDVYIYEEEPGVGQQQRDSQMQRQQRQRPMQRSVFENGRAEQRRRDTVLPVALALTAGGGLQTFTDSGAAGFTNTGGAWNVRAAFGTDYVITGEIAYQGSANDIEAVGLDPSATLLGNGVEGLARLNFLNGFVQPYVAAGVGWTNYQLVNSDFNTSAVEDSDNVVTIPLGGGVGFRWENILLDARATFRPVIADDLFDQTDDPSGLNNFQAQINAGWEF